MSELVQGSPAWLAMRKRYIGASDAPVIMGVSPWSTPYELWRLKVGLDESPPDNFAMKRGRELEPIALACYNEQYGADASPCVLFSAEHSFAMASLDGLDLDGSIIEIKCPGDKSHAIALRGDVPEVYYPQLQHQMMVANASHAWYFSYRGPGNFCRIRVERDDSYIDELLEAEAAFWECVETLTPPNTGVSDILPRGDREWSAAALEYRIAKAELDAAKEREDAARKELIELAGDCGAEGCGVRLSTHYRKGSVDYAAIPELADVDLEQYRKRPAQQWRITCGAK